MPVKKISTPLAMSGRSKLLVALLSGGALAGGAALANNKTAPQQITPPPTPQAAPPQLNLAQRLAMPSLIGAGIGGLGGLVSGSPIRGAATGLGTGAGFTAGAMGGNALADAVMGPSQAGDSNTTARLLFGLGGGVLGGIAGNRITNSLVKKRRNSEEQEYA